MAKSKDPAFLWYPGDFIAGTSEYTFEEVGAYVALINKQFEFGGPLPEDKIKRILRESYAKLWPVIQEKFVQDENGAWFNKRLESERTKRQAFTESRRNSLNIDNNDSVHIYLMADPQSGYYKIGSSKYPLLRLSEMHKRNPNVILIWKSDVLVIRSIEKELHQEFKPKKIKNDWFSLSEDDLTSIVNRKIFRTEANNESRTVVRTVNENENRNEDINVFEYQLKKTEKKIESLEYIMPDESLKDFSHWTDQVIAGSDFLFTAMAKSIPVGNRMEALARDHLEKAARYKWHAKADSQQAFRLSLLNFVKENYNKQPNAQTKGTSGPTGTQVGGTDYSGGFKRS